MAEHDYLIVGAGLFGGRLADYRYYDMHLVVRHALDAAAKEFS